MVGSMNLIVRAAEFVLVRIQDRLGIPRWWLIRTSMNVYIGLNVIESVASRRLLAWSVVWAVTMIACWTVNANGYRRDQEEADNRRQIVPNPTRPLWGITTWVVLILTGPLIPLRGLRFADACYVAALWAFSLAGTHTFPMVGPTFRERLRGWLTFRRQVAVEEA